MSYHRIDLAVHDGMLAIITLSLGRSLEAPEAELLAKDVMLRIERIAGRPAAIVLDLRGLFEVDARAFEIINDLEQRARRNVNLLDICHVMRQTPQTDAILQAQLSEDKRPSPMFETCAEAVGFLTGGDEGMETSVA
jgi:hypothetical protein